MVRRRGDEFHMSKVVQLRAAIAPRGFALPQHLNLMSSDAGNRVRWHDIGPAGTRPKAPRPREYRPMNMGSVLVLGGLFPS
jgi:hypothetical protein